MAWGRHRQTPLLWQTYCLSEQIYTFDMSQKCNLQLEDWTSDDFGGCCKQPFLTRFGIVFLSGSPLDVCHAGSACVR